MTNGDRTGDDFSARRREQCERLLNDGGHASPRGSRSQCARCGRMIAWEDQRWEMIDTPNGQQIVSGIHDCVVG